MAPDSPSIAILGAAGFVGRHLLDQLEAAGVRATAVVRGFPELAVDGDYHAVVHPDAACAAGPYDVVVNLAYPTAGSPFEQPILNAAILESVAELVADGGHVVHASTIAVFGTRLERPITTGPVAGVRDRPYVESKIEAELALAAEQQRRGLAVDIVRLGNIWGAASGTWALPIVHRLITGRPVGLSPEGGWSNATEVRNAASYFAHLATRRAEPGLRFHHLAEFAGVRWGEFIAPIAAALRAEPVYYPGELPPVLPSALAEVRSDLHAASPTSVYKKVSDDRVLGSVTRSLIRRMPPKLQKRLRSDGLVFAKTTPDPDWVEAIFLTNMSSESRFDSQTANGWSPPVDRTASMEAVLAWLDTD